MSLCAVVSSSPYGQSSALYGCAQLRGVGQSGASRPQTECFSTFRAAISEATGGRVTDAPASAAGFAHDRALQERVFAETGQRSGADSGGFTARSVSGAGLQSNARCYTGGRRWLSQLRPDGQKRKSAGGGFKWVAVTNRA